MTAESTIAERGERIAEEFAFFDDWLGRYEYLIELGKQIPLIDPALKTDERKIKGCQSQVWLHATLDDGVLRFTADSDALITKGLIALLIRVLDGEAPEAVADADLSFIDQIGMNEHLSPTRKNGLSSMISRIRGIAKFAVQAGAVPGDGEPENSATATVRPGGAAREPATEDELERIRERVIQALRLIYDPEIPINIYDMGLIYDIFVFPDRSVKVRMTLTTPNCPAAGFLPSQVETGAANVEGVSEAEVELTFDPPYTIANMSDEAKLELGLL